MNSAAQPSILVDDSDACYYPLLAYARVGEHSHNRRELFFGVINLATLDMISYHCAFALFMAK